jgi:glutathione synthase
MTKIAFVMDPLPGLNLKKDSTLAMIRAAQLRDLEIHYLTQADLYLSDERVRIRRLICNLSTQPICSNGQP